MKSTLGIGGIESSEYAWRSKSSEKGAQVDLIIDRKDGVINLCEMKYTNDEYQLDNEEVLKLQNRVAAFQKETTSKKAIHITLVAANGVKTNKYSSAIQRMIIGDDLFE